MGEESRRAAAAAFARRLRTILWIAAAIGLVATAAQLVLEGAEAAGISGFSALTKTIIEETLETNFGTVWGLAFLAWIAIAPHLSIPRVRTPPSSRPRPGPRPREDPRTNLPAVRERGSFLGPSESSLAPLALLAVPLVYLILCPALAGHGSSQSPVALNFPVNVVHVGAMAIWLGGLGALLLVLPAATRSAADAGRPRPPPRRAARPLLGARPGDGHR